jgi:hypothetical protein
VKRSAWQYSAPKKKSARFERIWSPVVSKFHPKKTYDMSAALRSAIGVKALLPRPLKARMKETR